MVKKTLSNDKMVGLLREFLKMKPYQCQGEPNLEKANKWLKKGDFSFFFEMLHTLVELRVCLASYLFEGGCKLLAGYDQKVP